MYLLSCEDNPYHECQKYNLTDYSDTKGSTRAKPLTGKKKRDKKPKNL